MSQITTHVLDVSLGQPAAGVPVVLEREGAGGEWRELGRGATDLTGRLSKGLAPDPLTGGTYRLTFNTRIYFESRAMDGFYPQVTIAFKVEDPKQHYHIPLLLGPFGYTTYRGS